MIASNQPLRIAVIGFGKLGLLHAGIVNCLRGSRLAAVVDSSSTILGVLRSRLDGVRTYSSHRKLLDDGGIDAAFITTPTAMHVPIAVEFVNAGIPVFIEKPLSTTATAAKPLLAALAARPVVNMVGYMTRHAYTFAKAKALVDGGALGALHTFRATMYVAQLFRAGKGWRYDKRASGGGVLITQNAHLVDQLLWMFGELDWISGHVKRLYSKTVEDYAHGYLAFTSGLTGFLDTSWSARHHRTTTMSILVQGERGTLEVDDDVVRLYLDKAHGDVPAGWTTWRNPDLYEGVSFDIGGPHYTRQAEQFLSAVRGNGAVGSDGWSAYEVQCAIDAFYRSAGQNGAPVSISEVT